MIDVFGYKPTLCRPQRMHTLSALKKFMSAATKVSFVSLTSLVLSKLMILISAEFISFAREHVFLEPWRKMAVVALNHANAGAHLYGQGVNIHTIVYQSKCRVSMAQAVQCSVKTRAWAFDQLALFHECTEGLVDVFTHSPIRQSKYWQIYTLFQ